MTSLLAHEVAVSLERCDVLSDRWSLDRGVFDRLQSRQSGFQVHREKRLRVGGLHHLEVGTAHFDVVVLSGNESLHDADVSPVGIILLGSEMRERRVLEKR